MIDLIRREDVIKLVNKFVFGLCKAKNDEVIKIFNKYVEKIPIAYSVDKVVKELEEMKMRYFLTIANTGDEKSDFAYENVGNALDRAIEIVKQGGVNDDVSDDVCEWKVFDNSLTDEPQWVYETTCGKYVGEEHTSKAFVYCPYCGKKIKEMESD